MKIRKGDLVFYFADYDEKVENSGLVTGTLDIKDCIDVSNQNIIERTSIFSIIKREEILSCWWEFLN